MRTHVRETITRVEPRPTDKNRRLCFLRPPFARNVRPRRAREIQRSQYDDRGTVIFDSVLFRLRRGWHVRN